MRHHIYCSLATSIIVILVAIATAPMTHGQLPIRATMDGDSGADRFGWSVSGAGDVNGDGFDDVIVGARFDDDNGSSSGSARIFSGADGTILYTFFGDSPIDVFGTSVSGAGDVNNDGYADVIVGAPLDDDNGLNPGSARIFSGFDGAILYTFFGDSADDEFGSTVSGAGDVNGDGFDDLIVGAQKDDNNGPISGSARIFSGFDGTQIHSTYDGAFAHAAFGISVSGAGDVNADGFDDVIVGERQGSSLAGFSGAAYIYSGVDGTLIHRLEGVTNNEGFGWSVSDAGDVNGDGFADVIVGGISASDNGANSGRAYIFSGFDGAQLHATFVGDDAGDQLGYSVGAAGDVNADGFDDVIVGIGLDDDNGTDAGSFRIYSGADATILLTANGGAADDGLGRTVSAAGDVNGDGFDDVIIGAPGSDTSNGGNSGRATIYSACGQRAYGVGIEPTQTLSCKWCPGDPMLDVANGAIIVDGAASFGTGILALSTLPAMQTVLDFTFLVDIAPKNALIGGFGFNASGSVFIPLSLRQPILAGHTFYFQAIETSGAAPMGVFTSNAIELLFNY